MLIRKSKSRDVFIQYLLQTMQDITGNQKEKYLNPALKESEEPI